MAGEWIPIDVCLPQKPEVLEIQEATGAPIDAIVGRLIQLWGWATMHCDDGGARMNVGRLGRMFGGDDQFWHAVQAVGWLQIDAEHGTVTVPGWDRRFSQSAKSRAQHCKRAKDSRSRALERTTPVRSVAPEERRGEENSSSSSSEECCAPGGSEAWGSFRDRWNKEAKRGHRVPFHSANPPAGALARLSEEGWLDNAKKAADMIGRGECPYFESPVTMGQFVEDGFVDKVLEGAYANPKSNPRTRAIPTQDRPSAAESARRWEEDVRKQRQARRSIQEQLKADGEAERAISTAGDSS